MATDTTKEKLKRRGEHYYSKYFYNPKEIIEDIIKQIDKGVETIDDSKCEVIFDITPEYYHTIPDLYTYYQILIKEQKFITNEWVDEFYVKYGETIEVMKHYRALGKKSVSLRGRMVSHAKERAKEKNIPFNITGEDIILNKYCPYLNTPLNFENEFGMNNSPTLDRIIPELGYVKGNVQVVSGLANRMKNNASIEQLRAFANSIFKFYGSL